MLYPDDSDEGVWKGMVTTIFLLIRSSERDGMRLFIG